MQGGSAVELCAKDIMERDVVTVRPETAVDAAMETVLREAISGLPVVDARGNLVGVVTEKDLLAMVYDKLFGQAARPKTVADLMTREVMTFEDDASVLEIAECLIRRTFRRVPILHEGRLVGVVSRPDVIRAILGMRERQRQD
jgi:CBS-domain-containing membrane protein